MAEALKKVEGSEKNQFASYAIKSRNEDKENPEDITSFDEFQHRITSTFKDTKDSMYIDAYFNLIDNDGDGFISYSDLEELTHEVGNPCMSEKDFLILADKFNHDSTQIGKA